MKKILFALFLILSAFGQASADPAVEQKLQNILDSFIANNPTIPGVMVALDSKKHSIHWRGAAGIAERASGKAMQADQPLRLASTTKTYTAASILRLMEQGMLKLDDPISIYISADQTAALRKGGYDPNQITIRHLLTHTSGLFDYAMSEDFDAILEADPSKRWTRDEQLQFAMDHGKPYGRPGEIYHYSDTGYILLGEIIERRSGKDYAAALRDLLHFDALGLKATWLETLEARPVNVPARAHQYWGETDTSGWDPSFDLYGGGGLVANMPDVARFYRALFNGEVFGQKSTLAEMKTTIIPDLGGPGSVEEGYGIFQYCLGISAGQYRQYSWFQHEGFWGTAGGYMPALDLAYGIAITQQMSGDARKNLTEALFDAVIDTYLDESQEDTH